MTSGFDVLVAVVTAFRQRNNVVNRGSVRSPFCMTVLSNPSPARLTSPVITLEYGTRRLAIKDPHSISVVRGAMAVRSPLAPCFVSAAPRGISCCDVHGTRLDGSSLTRTAAHCHHGGRCGLQPMSVMSCLLSGILRRGGSLVEIA